MKFTVNGEAYEIPDLDDLSTRELREVKEHTGMGIRSLGAASRDMDPDALVAIVYLAKRRAGEKVSWDDFDDLRPLKDIEWPDDDATAGDDGTADGEAQPPPTRRSRSTGSSRTVESSNT